MILSLKILLVVVESILVYGISAVGQPQYCSVSVLNAVRPVPTLRYKCLRGDGGYEKAIKSPQRIRALRKYEARLTKWYSAAWWASPVDELIACDISKKPGALTEEQVDVVHGGEYYNQLFGNKEVRVIRVDDPCFKSDYGDSNIFLLYHLYTGVTVTELIDDFFSRADDPMDVNFATFHGEKIVEVGTTTGGLQPNYINYYFGVNEKTGKAKRKLWFRGEDGKLTNQVRSEMLMEEPPAYGLSDDTEPVQVISKGKLATSFVVYRYKGNLGETDHPEFERVVLRWNGRYFQ